MPGVHPLWNIRHEALESSMRGLAHGVTTGVRIRLPYIVQSILYAGLFRDPQHFRKLKFVIKAAFHHGKNLGLFVCIYKTICHICRKYMGISNGAESLLAGFVGGYTAFGESKGISGAVNMQIVLYLFVRAVYAFIKDGAQRLQVRPALDVSTPSGFRTFAGISLALILYLTEHRPELLQRGFMSTMNYLYYDSDVSTASKLPPPRFLVFYFIIMCSLVSRAYPKLSLDNILNKVVGE